jgi:hypothetical protein
MTIQRIETGPRMSKVVIHGGTVYLAGLTANRAMAEPSHIPAATRASAAPTARLILTSAERFVEFAEFFSDMVTSLAQSGAA